MRFVFPHSTLSAVERYSSIAARNVGVIGVGVCAPAIRSTEKSALDCLRIAVVCQSMESARFLRALGFLGLADCGVDRLGICFRALRGPASFRVDFRFRCCALRQPAVDDASFGI